MKNKTNLCWLIALIPFLSLLFIHPVWRTNDDVGMINLLYGIGISNTSTYNIVFSNVLYAMFVRLFDNPFILGYTLLTYLGYYLNAVWVSFILIRCSKKVIINIFVLIIVFLYPIVFPQFTFGSGLCMLSGLLGLYVFSDEVNKKYLFTSLVFIIFGFLIREQMALFMILVFSPLIFIKAYKNKKLILWLVATAILVLFTGIIDRVVKDQEKYKEYNAFNEARIQFVDYRAGDWLIKNPDVMKKYNLSDNDIYLISSYFFADKKLIDFKVLNGALKDSYFFNNVNVYKLSNAKAAILLLISNKILVLLVLLVLFITFLNIQTDEKIFKYLILVFFLIISAFAIIGFLGRPGVFRIYFPPMCALFIFSLIFSFINYTDLKHKYIFIIVFILSGYAAKITLKEIIAMDKVLKGIDLDNKNINNIIKNKNVIVLANAFPYEMAYRPFYNKNTNNINIYSLASFTLHPNTISDNEIKKNNYVLNMFGSQDGAYILCFDPNLKYIKKYCEERGYSNFESECVYRTSDQSLELGTSILYHIKCY